MMFKCDMCGQCCRHLDRSEIYKEIDRGGWDMQVFNRE